MTATSTASVPYYNTMGHIISAQRNGSFGVAKDTRVLLLFWATALRMLMSLVDNRIVSVGGLYTLLHQGRTRTRICGLISGQDCASVRPYTWIYSRWKLQWEFHEHSRECKANIASRTVDCHFISRHSESPCGYVSSQVSPYLPPCSVHRTCIYFERVSCQPALLSKQKYKLLPQDENTGIQKGDA